MQNDIIASPQKFRGGGRGRECAPFRISEITPVISVNERGGIAYRKLRVALRGNGGGWVVTAAVVVSNPALRSRYTL